MLDVLPQLRSLSWPAQGLQALPALASCASWLTALHLADNWLDHCCRGFERLKACEVLDLSGNPLIWKRAAAAASSPALSSLAGMPSLRHLGLVPDRDVRLPKPPDRMIVAQNMQLLITMRSPRQAAMLQLPKLQVSLDETHTRHYRQQRLPF